MLPYYKLSPADGRINLFATTALLESCWLKFLILYSVPADIVSKSMILSTWRERIQFIGEMAKAGQISMKLNSRSVMEGVRNKFQAVIGEEFVPVVWGYAVRSLNIDYDFVFPKRKIKIDVKTKGREDTPRENYDATIPENQKENETDFYLFASLLFDMDACLLWGGFIGQFVGVLEKNRFWERSEKLQAHHITNDPNGNLKRGSWRIDIGDLNGWYNDADLFKFSGVKKKTSLTFV